MTDITADQLTAAAPSRSRLLSALIAGGPLVLLLVLFTVNTELFYTEPEFEPAPIFYQPVAVVFVGTSSEWRQVPLEGEAKPARTAALRVTEKSQIISVRTKPGAVVGPGEPLCRIKPLAGGSADVIYAPIGGRVTSVNGLSGTILEAGQPCLTIADTSAAIATAEITPRYAEIIEAGDKVKVTVDGIERDTEIRVVYPQMGRKADAPRILESVLPGLRIGNAKPAEVKLRTEQILPTLVPQRTLILDRKLGLCVRIVTGTGPTGRVKTLPVKLVSATDAGFYVEGLPLRARLIIENERFPVPEDGEVVRIGSVGL